MRGPPLARRIAANIAKLPELLIKTQKFTPSIGSGRCSIAARQTYRLDKSKLRQSQPRANHERARKQRRRSSGDARNCRTSLQRRYRPHVRFGSKADIGAPPSNVCFTPESGHHRRLILDHQKLILDHQNPLAHAASTCRSTMTGSVKVNVEPWPGCDSTQILPPCISMMRFDMASPKPVPPFLRVMALSAC